MHSNISRNIKHNLEIMKLTVILVTILVVATSATNYCAKCSNHIACNNNGQFKNTCPKDAYLIPMSNSAIQVLVKGHNSVRNLIAGGGQPGFSKASQMNVVVSIKT